MSIPIEEVKEQAKKEAATKADLELVEARLDRKIESVKAEIEKSKSETLKWMFLFWTGQIIAILAMFKAFVK